MFSFKKDILEAIGHTPLVRLNKIVPPNSATVLVKCEHMNPTGSIKDRMAFHIIDEAEKTGLLKPGGTIVENTSGNTGLAVAMVAAVKGYRCVFTMPDKMSLEKINMLKSFGAEVVITPTDVPGDSPKHYVNVAKRIAQETPGAFYVDQYHNKLNTKAHYLYTGKEIYEETNGEFDVFVAAAGTGGTISGVAQYLKEKKPSIRTVGVDPYGSVHFDLFYHKRIVTPPYVYKVEGMGEDIKCEALAFEPIDEFRQVDDKQCFNIARRLVREEGIFCGGSSGGNVHVALEIAKEIGPGKTVITVLTDSGTRYITKYLADSWMIDNGFMSRDAGLGQISQISNGRGSPITANENDSVSSLIERMKKEQVSQLPVLNSSGKLVGIVHEIDLLRGITAQTIGLRSPAHVAATKVSSTISSDSPVESLYQIFERGEVALVLEGEKLVDVLTKIDLIEFLSRRRKTS